MAEYKTINTSVMVMNDVITAALGPINVQVTNFKHTNEETILVWNIPEGGGMFDPDNPFTWNTMNTDPDPPAVKRVNDRQLQSAPYKNTVAGDATLTWVYTVRINKAGQRIGIDPEVDNLPPNP
ncbi:MAG TPA: hypothetical protein VKB93_09735 [Thermoanaerobaculia bacterium]|nr:hypothetical protein [Thermoanaerobaculia bacterium]